MPVPAHSLKQCFIIAFTDRAALSYFTSILSFVSHFLTPISFTQHISRPKHLLADQSLPVPTSPSISANNGSASARQPFRRTRTSYHTTTGQRQIPLSDSTPASDHVQPLSTQTIYHKIVDALVLCPILSLIVIPIQTPPSDTLERSDISLHCLISYIFTILYHKETHPSTAISN